MTVDRIKLFVGCDPNGCDVESQMVLEYTARKNSSLPIDIVWMMHSNNPQCFWHGWESSLWSTPFSGFRWGIPEHCGFQGQAIYMDSDMIVLGDLAELWNNPWNETAVVQAKGNGRFCVMKWNCARAKGYRQPLVADTKAHPQYHRFMISTLSKFESQMVQKFDRQWNNFDGENDALEDIKILHYTDMSTQPHLKYAIPRLWNTFGQKHWYDGELRKHRRDDVVALFDWYYEGAKAANFYVEDYYTLEHVDFKMESQRNYRSNNGFDVTQGQ